MSRLVYLPAVDSTNRTAMELAEWEHLSGVMAERQTGGKGRLGRSFFSPAGGLYLSVLLEPQKIGIPLSLITPAAALAVKGALEAAGFAGLQIKWVNDILLQGKKVCGILTEAKSEKGAIERIVCGIGINLGTTAFPTELQDKASSLPFTGDKKALAADIVGRLGKLISDKGSDVVAAYEKALAFLGENITVTDYAAGNRQVSGKLLGVTAKGYLRLRLSDGNVSVLSSAEII